MVAVIVAVFKHLAIHVLFYRNSKFGLKIFKFLQFFPFLSTLADSKGQMEVE